MVRAISSVPETNRNSTDEHEIFALVPNLASECGFRSSYFFKKCRQQKLTVICEILQRKHFTSKFLIYKAVIFLVGEICELLFRIQFTNEIPIIFFLPIFFC
jgi:hypothetical protein